VSRESVSTLGDTDIELVTGEAQTPQRHSEVNESRRVNGILLKTSG
jgi:hypothetical protein